jgi:hypothetical protein
MTQLSPSNATMSQTPTPPPTNINAAATATVAAANASAIMTSAGSMPVAVIGLKLIGMTIPNVLVGNRRGSGAAQKAANANTKLGLGHFSQLNPLVAAQKATSTNQKGLGNFSQLNPLIKLRPRPARSTCRA